MLRQINAPRVVGLSPEYIAESQAQFIVIPASIFLLLVTLLAILCFWGKLSIHKRFYAEDWCLLVAVLSCIGTNIIFLCMIKAGLGRHLSVLPLIGGNSETIQFLYWIMSQFYRVSLYLVKITFLLFYRRVFHIVEWLRRTSLALMVVVGSYLMASFMVTTFQCKPVSKSWIFTLEGHCITRWPFWLSNAIFNTATDIIIFFLPVAPLRSMRSLSPGQRRALIPVFGVGALVTALSATRIQAVLHDPDWSDSSFYAKNVMFTLLEVDFANVCACLPWVWVVFTKWYRRRQQRAADDNDPFAGEIQVNHVRRVGGRDGGERDEARRDLKGEDGATTNAERVAPRVKHRWWSVWTTTSQTENETTVSRYSPIWSAETPCTTINL